jgi:hypothetical protein
MKKNDGNLPTLSIKHNKIITEIKEREKSIPELIKHKEELLKHPSMSYEMQYKTNTEIEKIDNEIATIKKLRLDYFIKNADILFEYNELDNTNLMAHTHPSAKAREPENAPSNNYVSRHNNCFKNKSKKSTTNIITYTQPPIKLSKADLLKKYLLNNDPNYNHMFQYSGEDEFFDKNNVLVRTHENAHSQTNIKINNNTFCYKCNKYRDLNDHEAKLYCFSCGESVPVILESDKPSSKDYPTEARHYEYKKFNHFCYWLAKIQGKESCDIPAIVIETIKRDIMRDKIENLNLLNESDIKEYLKKYKNIGYDKYYNHTIFILMTITGNPPIILSLEQEREYKMMFIIIQELYEIYKPDDRSNFGSYSYIIYKFAQLRGDVEIMKKMKLLKCREKLHNLDVIWQKICNHLGGAEKGWQYIPTY